MTGKPEREMTDGEYTVYQKTHDSEHPVEVESGKVRREKTSAARKRRKNQDRVKNRLQKIEHPEDVDDWDDDALIDEIEAEAEREMRNARTHKERLKRLERYQKQAEQDKIGSPDSR